MKYMSYDEMNNHFNLLFFSRFFDSHMKSGQPLNVQLLEPLENLLN